MYRLVEHLNTTIKKAVVNHLIHDLRHQGPAITIYGYAGYINFKMAKVLSEMME